MKTIHFQRNSWKVNIESLFLDFKRSVLINHILPLHNFGLTPVFPALFKYNWNQIFLMREELVDKSKKAVHSIYIRKCCCHHFIYTLETSFWGPSCIIFVILKSLAILGHSNGADLALY